MVCTDNEIEAVFKIIVPKQDSEDYKVLFQKAQCRIKELSEELKKVKEDNDKKDKDM